MLSRFSQNVGIHLRLQEMESYQRVKVIGKGSYGEVWLAMHVADRKQYVLKKVELRNASKRERKAAEQEAKLLSKLKHPNIVAYKDSFQTDDGLLWIAMGYCEGGDLYSFLKSRKGTLLEERQIVEWFVQISMALQYLHERNVLHRDLKTQNIFLTRSRIIKVGDLGIARVLDSESDMATTLIGTPYYMSPELFANKPYNHKSDVWALGCCVHEMASLKHAFNAKDMNSLMYKILRGRTPPMPEQYSRELADLVKAMLSQNPSRRPSVVKILRDPYIRKNIAIFLEGTKNRARRPTSSIGGSGDSSTSSSQRAAGSASSASRKSLPKSPDDELPVRGAPRDLDTITEVSQSDAGSPQPQLSRSPRGSAAGRSGLDSPKPSGAAMQNEAQPSSSQNSHAAAAAAAASVAAIRNGSVATPSPRPRPVDSSTKAASTGSNGRQPLPSVSSSPVIRLRSSSDKSTAIDVTPAGASARRSRADSSEPAGEPLSARSDSEPSLSSTNPNLPARARRREKKSQSADVANLAQPVKVAAEPVAAAELRSSSNNTVTDESEDTVVESPEGVDGKVGDGDGQLAVAAAADRDMAKLTVLLDATLNMQPEIEDEEDDGGAGDDDGASESRLVDQTPSEAAESRADAGRHPVAPSSTAGPRPAAPSAFGRETLGSTTRLNDRITVLHRDCVRGVGYERLRKAYEILNSFEEDEVEMRLRKLLGNDLFDEYAGKIWQLKFCEESALRR